MASSSTRSLVTNNMIRSFVKIFTIAGLLFCPAIAFSQNKSESFRPQWMHRLPVPTNTTFIYKTVSASSNSLEEARKQTVIDLIDDAGLKGGVAIVSDHRSKERVSQVWENGKLVERITNDWETTTSAKSSEMILHASLIDEYWTRDAYGIYHITRLYAKSELGRMPLYDNVELTTKYYNDPATWGLSLIPGAAQMHKGSYLKGGLIIGGTVALAGTALAMENLRNANVAKISQSHSADVRKQYNDRATACATTRNICLGGLAALYIYNIVDAYVAPGARRIIVTPAASPDGLYGMAVSYKF